MFCTSFVYFSEGQGVKIFVVAKFCKDKSFLIPVLKKPKSEEEKEELKKKRGIEDFGDDDE